jgi:hypothetical protein
MAVWTVIGWGIARTAFSRAVSTLQLNGG